MVVAFVGLVGCRDRDAGSDGRSLAGLDPDATLGEHPQSLKATVTIYGATWCPSCRSLEASLRARSIPFRVIDIDKNRAAYEAAAKISGKRSGIPLTRVERGDTVRWFEGADPRRIERAYRGHAGQRA